MTLMDWLCWCGEQPFHKTSDGRAWCRAHAPRCRSGAHLYGNCECTGCDCPRRGHGQGSHCRADRYGLKWDSGDWCDCKCHVAPPAEVAS